MIQLPLQYFEHHQMVCAEHASFHVQIFKQLIYFHYLCACYLFALSFPIFGKFLRCLLKFLALEEETTILLKGMHRQGSRVQVWLLTG